VTTFTNALPHVGNLRTSNQMLRVDANAVVAQMPSYHFRRHASTLEHDQRQPVRSDVIDLAFPRASLVSQRDRGVSVSQFPDPLPTRRSLIEGVIRQSGVREQTICERFVLSRHTYLRVQVFGEDR
jgi:hypothetical protein